MIIRDYTGASKTGKNWCICSEMLLSHVILWSNYLEAFLDGTVNLHVSGMRPHNEGLKLI